MKKYKITIELKPEYINKLKSIQDKAEFLDFNSINEFRKSIENKTNN